MTTKSNVLQRERQDKAVYWGNPKSDGYGGRTFDQPVEISINWQDGAYLYHDAIGKEAVADAVAFPDRELDMDGYVWKGTLATLPNSDPMSLDDAYRIVSTGEQSNPRRNRTIYKIWIGRRGRITA